MSEREDSGEVKLTRRQFLTGMVAVLGAAALPKLPKLPKLPSKTRQVKPQRQLTLDAVRKAREAMAHPNRRITEYPTFLLVPPGFDDTAHAIIRGEYYDDQVQPQRPYLLPGRRRTGDDR